MSLTVGTNSWVTIAESNTYMADRWNSAAWTDGTISDAQKEQLLVTAYRWIQAQPQFSIAASSTETAVKEAQIELAWYVYKFFDETEKRRALYAQGVRDFSLGKWEEELEKGGFPDFINDMLSDELTNLGGYFPTASRDFE